MSIRPNPEIEKLKVCPHGGPNYAELRAMGLAADEIIDFSVSSNPFSFPPEVRDVFDSVVIDRYPDSESTELRVCLSGKLGVHPDNILVGNGSTEIIRLIALAYFGHGDSVLILKPTFGEYELACQIVSTEILEQWGKEEECFAVNTDETVALIRQHHPKGVFICNPNNPTGQYLSQQEVERVLKASPQSLVILDEASSRLDPATEVLIDRAVVKLLENRTSIIIAHRLATLNQVDTIAILDQGKIVETGRRVELEKNKNSKFSQLLKTDVLEVLV